MMTKKLVSSKDVLSATEISRATLNNYIKMGILPKPIIQRPEGVGNTIRKMGYFPRDTVATIERVKRLKTEGHPMEEIVNKLKGKRKKKGKERKVELKADSIVKREAPQVISVGVRGKEMNLSLEYLSFAGYVINYNFEVIWINGEAEENIFWQGVGGIHPLEDRNIFKLLFNWEFHNRVQNWKDILTFHMSFLKEKYAKTWIKKLYKGISESEVTLLEDIYDKVPTCSGDSIKENQVNLLMMDGTTKSYSVYSISFREGLLLAYAPIGRVLGF